MGQLIVFGVDESFVDKMEIPFRVFLDLDLIKKKSVEEVVELISLMPEGASLLYGDLVNLEALKSKLSIVDKGSEIILTISSGEEGKYSKEKTIKKDDSTENILKSMGTYLGIPVKIDSSVKEVKMKSIDINFFYLMNQPISDIFLSTGHDKKESMGESDDSLYVKRFDDGEKIELEVLDALDKRGIKQLYVPEEDYLFYFNNIVSEAEEKIVNNRFIPIDSRIRVTDRLMKAVYNRVDEGSFGPDLQDLVSIGVSSLKKIEESFLSFKDLMHRLKLFSKNIHFIQAAALSWIFPRVLKKFEWSSKEHDMMLRYVSFFHNIYLKDKKMVEVRSEQMMKEGDFTKEEILEILHHAEKASTLVQKLTKAPREISTLIAQHHGVKKGVGFVDIYSSNAVTPLGMVFLLSDEFINLYLAYQGRLDKLDQVCEEKEKRFLSVVNQKIFREILIEIKGSVAE